MYLAEANVADVESPIPPNAAPIAIPSKIIYLKCKTFVKSKKLNLIRHVRSVKDTTIHTDRVTITLCFLFSVMERFYKNSEQLKVFVHRFCKKAPSQMFQILLNTPLLWLLQFISFLCSATVMIWNSKSKFWLCVHPKGKKYTLFCKNTLYKNIEAQIA